MLLQKAVCSDPEASLSSEGWWGNPVCPSHRGQWSRSRPSSAIISLQSPASSSSTCPWKPPRWTTTCSLAQTALQVCLAHSRAQSEILLPTHEASSAAARRRSTPHAGGHPWGRTAGCPGGGKVKEVTGRISSEPGGQQAASGKPKLSRCLLCPSWMSTHRLCDCSSGQSPAELALPVPTGGPGCGLEGLLVPAAQDCEGGGTQTSTHPALLFPLQCGSSQSLCAPSSCLSTTSSGTSSSSSSAPFIPR